MTSARDVERGELERLIQVLRIGLLCNESSVIEEGGRIRLEGDPTEGALVVAAVKAPNDPPSA